MTDNDLDGIERLRYAGDIPKLVAEVRRLRGLVKGAERTGGLAGNSPPYVLGCPWCLSAPTDLGLRHSLNCPAFTVDGNVK